MVRPVMGPTDREPDLITHHTHNGTEPDDFGYGDYDDDREGQSGEYAAGHDGYDDYDEDPELDENGKKKKPVLTPKQRKKRRWRRIRRTLYVLFGLFVVVPALAFVITYFIVDVPSADSVAALQNQPITFYYSDNSVMGKENPPAGSGGNRVPLKTGEAPLVVKHAVYSAEDASFETNSGFDVTGILRAVYNQVTGGQGGGSTISQQYIKQATANDAPTLTRKWTELAKSFKMNNEESKDEIITSYLNIVYFGRGAYGVQAAAKTYFDKDVKDLNASESALLAGLIQGPSRSENQPYATKRWTYVMDQMVANGWLSQADRAAATFPTPVPKNTAKDKDAGTLSWHIKDRVKAELLAKGYDDDKLYSSGAKIYTTIDPKAQKDAEQAVSEGMKGQTDDQILNSLVAVDPRTGGVVAYYGGPLFKKDDKGNDVPSRDWANDARNPGSSVKAFDLTAFLKMGKGLGETFDGTSGRTFGTGANKTAPVRNAGESASCSKECTVKQAMEISANTVFYDMVYNVTGAKAVVQAAKDAGVKVAPDGRSTLFAGDNNISLGGGGTTITPSDMASAYATFASGGLRRDQHFVAKVANASDEVEFEVNDPGKPAFDPDAAQSAKIAGNVTDALEPVIKHSDLTCPKGHECAGKTGTQQYTLGKNDPKSYADRNAQTWMVGYTPSISVAAWVGGDGVKPLHDQNDKPIFGKTIAGPIWQKFMDLYLDGQPGEKFDKAKPIGKDAATATPTPTRTSTSSTPTTESASTSETSTAPSTTSSSESASPTSRTRITRPGPPIGGGGPDPGGAGGGALLPNDPAG
ncbi:transglycosylase domain-containing protein [Amycolatopsis sp. H20-H5]|uniref:transglycosylase domain-containing protein n=1 Tax=Amycolatopsis sp. H20-H5 TaxID=3046309 RepID=UPI002DBA335C|nr:transglycosylase domain-containing protein [Amycolatopsis sp. H20-H5]MEC3981528.1 transglycosylase domain-containing protein [Amycolatopsis sp. H20-H5]